MERRLHANLVCRHGGDPVAVTETGRPFHLVPALGQDRDDLTFDVFLAPAQDDNVTRPEPGGAAV